MQLPVLFLFIFKNFFGSGMSHPVLFFTNDEVTGEEQKKLRCPFIQGSKSEFVKQKFDFNLGKLHLLPRNGRM